MGEARESGTCQESLLGPPQKQHEPGAFQERLLPAPGATRLKPRCQQGRLPPPRLSDQMLPASSSSRRLQGSVARGHVSVALFMWLLPSVCRGLKIAPSPWQGLPLCIGSPPR